MDGNAVDTDARSVWKEICFQCGVRLERETFGPVLRAARERSGVTLQQLAVETKLSADLWEALEENDLSRWPKRVFARSYVRDYALRVGLDGDEVVGEFCRLFPEWGDRRVERVMREQAEILAHDLEWEDLPASRRRSSDRAAAAAPGFVGRHRLRIAAVAVDMAAVLAGAIVGRQLGFDPWPSLAVSALALSTVTSWIGGRSFGTLAADRMFRAVRSLPAARRRLASSRV